MEPILLAYLGFGFCTGVNFKVIFFGVRIACMPLSEQ